MEEEGDESKDLDTTSGAEPAPLAGQDAAQTDPQQDKPSRQKEFWPLEFADPPEPFAGIILRNLLFNILTLWFYRFWARTNVRRYLWRNMTVQGDALEYTGRGLELFLGFLLIAVAVFLPLFIISTAVSIFATPFGYGFFTLVVYGLIVWLIGFGLFRARRYRLSRTIWRGVRASQSGSAREYGLRFLGYGILRVLSLGWFTPAANARLWAYRYNNTWFGDGRFEVTDNTGEGLYRAFFNAWVPMVGIFLIPIFWVIPGFYPGSGFLYLFTFVAWVLAPIALVFTWIWYKAFELRTLIGRLRFEGVQFQFDATGGKLFGLLFGNLLITFLTIGIAVPVTQRRVAAFVALHLSATGVADLDNIVQGAQEVPSAGEGIADALDFGAV